MTVFNSFNIVNSNLNKQNDEDNECDLEFNVRRKEVLTHLQSFDIDQRSISNSRRFRQGGSRYAFIFF